MSKDHFLIKSLWTDLMETVDRSVFIEKFADWVDAGGPSFDKNGVVQLSNCQKSQYGNELYIVDFGNNHQYSLDIINKMSHMTKRDLLKERERYIKVLYQDAKQLFVKQTAAAEALFAGPIKNYFRKGKQGRRKPVKTEI